MDKFPDYSAGYIVLIKSLENLGDMLLAELYLDEALRRFPFNKNFTLLKKQYDNPDKSKRVPEKLVRTKKEIAPKQQNFVELSENISKVEISDNLLESSKDEQIIEQEDLEIPVEITEKINSDIIPDENNEYYNDLKTIIEIPDEIQEHESFVEEIQDKGSFLKLVTSQDFDTEEADFLRASNPMLIPGIALTPLKSTKKNIFISHIKPLPPYPVFPSLPERKFSVLNFSLKMDRNERVDNNENEDDEITDNPFITETFAQIYVKQGEYKEAIKAYKELTRKNPGKKEKYDKIIEELKSK